MTQPSTIGPFTSLLDQFGAGQIDRRLFLASAGLRMTASREEAAELLIGLNDALYNDVADEG